MFWPFRKSARQFSKELRAIVRGDPEVMARLRAESWQDEQKDRLVDDGVCVTLSTKKGEVLTFCWDAIQEFAIITNSLGPFVDDVWNVVRTADGEASWPSGAAGEEPVLERMCGLPGFDTQKYIAAMGSTDDAEFVCWRRS